jgi:FAD/FMN-containing dehydrogenase
MFAGIRKVAAKLRPHATGASFLNFLSDPERTADAYTDGDYRRLREVKAAYDPDNVFAANHNIPPA